jgi:hypothetical protein
MPQNGAFIVFLLNGGTNTLTGSLSLADMGVTGPVGVWDWNESVLRPGVFDELEYTLGPHDNDLLLLFRP